MKSFAARVAQGLLALALTIPAWGQDAAKSYPSKPLRIVVGYSAGGGNDIIVRAMAPQMSEGLRQQVVIENRPGAQSIIAAEYVAKSPPDGYTILMGPSGPMTMNPAIYSKLPYSPLDDFAPITMIGSFPLILTVDPKLGLKTVKDLVRYAKASPEKANYAASAAPFQLVTELFKQKTGTQFMRIPYKGSGESVNAVVAGEVTMTISDPPPAIGAIQSGRVRALAVTSAKRNPRWPSLPTLAESGVPDVDVMIWTGFLAPAGTPKEIVTRLRDEVVRVVGVPDVRQRLSTMGIDPSANTPEEFRRIMEADIAKWKTVAKAADIRAD
jgi:tripartite-type tricarboxylate transporter receptor subunit TctC